jgi:hypothetical protein
MSGTFCNLASRMVFGLFFVSTCSFAVTETNLLANLKKQNFSHFDDRLPNGRDPFFPDSTRRNAVVPVPPTTRTTPDKPPRAPEPANLALKGVVLRTGTRMALINNQTFVEGETKYVRTPTGNVRVKCIEIQNRSVTIEVEGVPGRRELKLKEGL